MSNPFGIDMTSNLAFERTTTLAVCQVVNTAFARHVAEIIRKGDYATYMDLSVDPHDYEEPSEFAEDYLCASLLKKSLNVPLPGVDPEAAAKKSFADSEKRCREVNDLFRSYGNMLPDRINRVKRWVHRIVGSLTPRKLDNVVNSCRFGNGATTGVKGHGSVKSDKFDNTIHATLELYPFIEALMGPRWLGSHLGEGCLPLQVEGNKFFTVPKKATTHRGAAAEPTLNSFLQLGIDRELRKALKTFGVNLNDQTRNQRMAELAYAKGFATLDLSSASDLISWWVVFSLFPYDWFELLNLARSHRMCFDGEWIELEKFSSMGNGYTFAVETVIFLAVCFSCVPTEEHQNVSVYGDDIIVPQAYASDVVETLEALGFQVNESKSCLAGTFFESCGTDWLKGHNVRPFYLREDMDPDSKTGAPYVLQVANALRLWSKRTSYDGYCNSKWKPLWLELSALVPVDWRACRIPEQLGDTGLISSLEESVAGTQKPFKRLANKTPKGKRYVRKVLSGEEGWMVKHVHCRPRYLSKHSMGVLYSRLASLPAERPVVAQYIGAGGASIGVTPDVILTETGHRDSFVRLANTITRTTNPRTPFVGREARRGLFGKVVTKWALVSDWAEELAWR